MVARITMSGQKLYIVDTETVISHVESHKCLWNPHDESYKSKEAKQLAWQEVCMAVSPTYDTASAAERKQIEKAVHARWKTARDAYIKCRTDKGKNKYVFFDNLTFLEQARHFQVEEPNTENTPGSSSQHNNYEKDPLASEEEEEVLVKPNMTSRNHRMWQRRRTRNFTALEAQLLKIVRTIKTANANSKFLQEDDQSFFNSLGPIINGFDSHKKLLFRSRILDLAIEISDKQTVNIKQEKHDDYVMGGD